MSLKIMVIDDEPLSLGPMRPLAAPLGHTVFAFDNAQEVGERAEKQRFDVIFVGIPQPGGLELVRRIRNSQPNREATIVILSATDDVNSVRKAFTEGADLVLTKPITAARLRPMLAAMDSSDWKSKRHRVRLPLFTDVICTRDGRQVPLRSMNISESGMLLQPSVDIDIGQEVALQFKIAEVGASLSVPARIVRKEGTERIAVEFIGLTPEDNNAISLYLIGHLKDLTPPRDLSGAGTRGLFIPKE
jgi:CheY-like chemotaxis protein